MRWINHQSALMRITTNFVLIVLPVLATAWLSMSHCERHNCA